MAAQPATIEIEIPDLAKLKEQKIETVSIKPKAQEFRPVLKPKEKELRTVSVPKPKIIPVAIAPKPKEKEVEVVAAPVKPKVLPAPKPIPKEVKKLPPVAQAKPKEPVVVKPPEKPVAVVVKPPAVKPESPANVPAGSASDLSNRNIETIRTVWVKSDSLVLNLYDNGEVDGDTVSVILNGSIILGRQRLSTTAITKTIYMTPDLGDSIQLVMYAENLGSIPPNTGLLILQDANDRYEIRFSGDLKKNAAIIFKRRRL